MLKHGFQLYVNIPDINADFTKLFCVHIHNRYLGCTGPGARDVLGTWGVQSKCVDVALGGGATGPGARNVRGAERRGVPELYRLRYIGSVGRGSEQDTRYKNTWH